jgi:hypothetical protein
MAEDVNVKSTENFNGEEIFTLLGYYASSSDNPLPTFRDNI